MAAHQISSEEKAMRRRWVDDAIAELRLGVAQRATFGKGTVSEGRIEFLEEELAGMRRFVLRTLSGPSGLGNRSDAEAVVSELLASTKGEADVAFALWETELQQVRVDGMVRRAVKIHLLTVEARAALLEIEERRRQHHAAEKAAADAAWVSRLKAARAAGVKLEFRHRDEVSELIRQHTGQPYYDYGSAATLYGDAKRLGLFGEFGDVVMRLAAERHGTSWHYAGD